MITVELAPREVGFFDPLTNTYLSRERRTAEVDDKENLTNIEIALKSGRIRLKAGKLPAKKAVEGK